MCGEHAPGRADGHRILTGQGSQRRRTELVAAVDRGPAARRVHLAGARRRRDRRFFDLSEDAPHPPGSKRAGSGGRPDQTHDGSPTPTMRPAAAEARGKPRRCGPPSRSGSHRRPRDNVGPSRAPLSRNRIDRLKPIPNFRWTSTRRQAMVAQWTHQTQTQASDFNFSCSNGGSRRETWRAIMCFRSSLPCSGIARSCANGDASVSPGVGASTYFKARKSRRPRSSSGWRASSDADIGRCASTGSAARLDA